MRILILAIVSAVALLLACGAPAALTPPECLPSVVQPARGSGITLVARVTGCPNLVAVNDGTPGVILYVSRYTLAGFSDSDINALPMMHGEG